MKSDNYIPAAECLIDDCINLVEVRDNFNSDIEFVICEECYSRVQEMHRLFNIVEVMN
jgi:hypothetical protein